MKAAQFSLGGVILKIRLQSLFVLSFAVTVPMVVTLFGTNSGAIPGYFELLWSGFGIGMFNWTAFVLLAVLWNYSPNAPLPSRAARANSVGLLIGLPIAIAVDAYYLAGMEFGPKSSTSAIGYVFVPLIAAFWANGTYLFVALVTYLAFSGEASQGVAMGQSQTAFKYAHQRFIWISVAIGICLAVAAGAYQTRLKPPEAGTVLMRGPFTSRTYFEDDRLCRIRQVQEIDGYMAVICQRTLLVVSPSSRKVSKALENGVGQCKGFGISPRLIGNPAGTFWVTDEGGGFGDVAVHDEDGKTVLKYVYDGPKKAEKLLHCGWDANNKPVFFLLNKKGALLVGLDGKEKSDLVLGPADSACFLDDGDSPKVVFGSEGGSSRAYGFQQGLKKLRGELRFSEATLRLYGSIWSASLGDQMVLLRDLEGERQIRMNFLDYPAYHGPQVAVLQQGKSRYFGVYVEAPSAESTSSFMIFSEAGNLLQQEVLDKGSGLAIHVGSDGHRSFLVGSGHKVLEYSLN